MNSVPSDLMMNDPALSPVVDRWLVGRDHELATRLLRDLGADAATRLRTLAEVADTHPPVLRQFDRHGNRVDVIDYHPAYLELCEAAYTRYGLAALSHRPIHGWSSVPPYLVKYLASYLFVQAEFGLACPVSMTDAAARTLRMFGADDDVESFIDGLTSTDPSNALTGAMFMTEPQAGTDIAQTSTIAEMVDGQWRLSGKKWFASNPDADVIITLARYPGGDPSSTRGVGMFMVPKHLPDGKRNSYTIDRLKDKLGTRSMPSGEVTLHAAHGIQIGQLDRGFRQMAEMVNTSRLSNAMRSAALMRRAVRDAVAHTRERVVFGKTLDCQPLMKATLLPLLLDAEGALALVGFSAACLQRADAGETEDQALIRVLTPIAKHYVCKRARFVTGEAMEVRGGNGYIEEWGFAKLVRDSHLGSIWEGSSNVIALDVIRCMRKQSAHRHLATSMQKVLANLDTTCGTHVQELASRWDMLAERGDKIISSDTASAEIAAATYTDDLARAVIATLLYDLADNQVRHGRGYRSLLVAHAYYSGLFGEVNSIAIKHLNVIADGGDADANVGQAAGEAALVRGLA